MSHTAGHTTAPKPRVRPGQPTAITKSAFDGVTRVTDRTITREQIVEHYTRGTWPSHMVQCDFMKIVGDLAVEQLKARMAGASHSPATCDCLNDCGDDPWLKDGRARPCEALQSRLDRKLPRAIGVGRMADNDCAVMVTFRAPLTDVQLASLHDELSAGSLT